MESVGSVEDCTSVVLYIFEFIAQLLLLLKKKQFEGFALKRFFFPPYSNS